jgi:hypothetical protein
VTDDPSTRPTTAVEHLGVTYDQRLEPAAVFADQLAEREGEIRYQN